MQPLAITLGDPSGIGAEIVFRALQDIDVPARVFGSRALANPPDGIDFADVGGEGPIRYGEIDAGYGRVALDSIDAALHAIEAGHCSALVTAPIHKQSVALAGSPFPGHTELLAHRAGLQRYGHDYAMYFDSPKLKSALLSVHLPLRDAVSAIDADDVAALARLTSREYTRLYGRAPRIAVAGVNPHAGEGGRFGDEERVIGRGVARARDEGLTISGPHPADTIFLAATRGQYDVVLAMYHDQALIPIKTMAFDESVNVTIGLPYLRVSVDHGTAFDIAGRGIADAAPMRYAIRWATAHAGSYKR
ncbi:MAG TPA: 4-hydroxythreonine-4-phosphate dehydrogenase PdxA [Thermoanaerobaculia bacterium]|nr:4-hydroxythreonine-4-phosphate dehydrogenase PdxA [Thermoanaerobaculia bacterium]